MTQNRWCNLFLTCADAPPAPQSVTHALQDALTEAGYTGYNPFGVMPGRSYLQAVRAFVAPLGESWVRVILENPLPVSVLCMLSVDYVCVQVCLGNDDAQIDVCADGAPVQDIPATLAPYLRDGKTEANLRSALTQPQITVIDTEPEEFLDSDTLPEDVRQLAADVDNQAFNKMFERVSSRLFDRAGGDRDKARALVQQASDVNWNTPHGWKVQALMDALSLPPGWRKPSFSALSIAYGLHARHQRKPDARLYPGDEKAMQAVPDALEYTPVYAGKDDVS